jgi:hypothetical protein
MNTSQEKIGEDAEGCGFERRDNAFGFVSPVIQDFGYRFAIKDVNVIESYRKSDLYFVVKATALGKGADFDLVFRAVPRWIDEQLPNSAGASYIPKLCCETDAEKSVLVCISYPVEGPEDIIPSFVWLERPKDRKQFIWNIFASSAHAVLEVGRTTAEGEVSVQRTRVPRCDRRDSETRIVERRSNLMDCFSGFNDQMIRNSGLQSDSVDFVSRLIRVRVENHCVRATLQESACLDYKILDVQLCAN